MTAFEYVQVLGQIIAGWTTLCLAAELVFRPKYGKTTRIVGSAIFTFGGFVTLLLVVVNLLGG